jgi:hypothetical protein
LIFDPSSQLGVFAVTLRNVAVTVSFAIGGKLAQKVVPGIAAALPLEI